MTVRGRNTAGKQLSQKTTGAKEKRQASPRCHRRCSHMNSHNDESVVTGQAPVTLEWNAIPGLDPCLTIGYNSTFPPKQKYSRNPSSRIAKNEGSIGGRHKPDDAIHIWASEAHNDRGTVGVP